MSVGFRQEILSPVLEEEIAKIASRLVDANHTRLDSIGGQLLIVMDKHLDLGVHMTFDGSFPSRLSIDSGSDCSERLQTFELGVFEQRSVSPGIVRHVVTQAPVPANLVYLSNYSLFTDELRV